MTDTTTSINNLIGTFATVNTNVIEQIPTNMVCIDTSNQRIGINTIDPSYSLHILTGGTETAGLKIKDNTETVVILENLPTTEPGITGQLWNDSGTLKIKV